MRRDVLDVPQHGPRPRHDAAGRRSQLAANHVAKQRMRELYADYGVDVVEAVSERLIDQSEWLVRSRLTELPDGEWRVREYIDMPGANAKVELTATKEGDSLTYDFTGSSPQTELGVNCSYWATWGGLFAPIFPLLAWDVTWNEGVTRPIRLVAPEGTIVNCVQPAPISIATVGTIQIVNNLSTLVLSKLFGASERNAQPSDGGLARQPRARRDARLHEGRASSSSHRSPTRSAGPRERARSPTASTSAARSRTSSRAGRTRRARS